MVVQSAFINASPERELTNSASARAQHDAFFRYFGFRESPFGVTPNPEFLFSSNVHLGVLRSMVQSIESNLGFTVLLGGPGMGKTTLLLQLLTQYRDSARTAFIFQTQCKRYDLLRYLASELELRVMERDEVSLQQGLKEMLVNEARAGRRVLLIIDEAQNLQPSSLEAIRLLSDFETARAKLLHIVLAGSGQLGEKLLAPELLQLAQRISTICRLEPLNAEEVEGYVTFRLGVAGCRVAETLFSREALLSVADKSQGIPRIVNSICYNALALVFALGERHVTGQMVRQAADALDLSDSSGHQHATNHVLRTVKQYGGNSFVNDTEIIREEKLDPHERGPELRQTELGEEESECRSVGRTPFGNSGKESLNSQSQGESVPVVHQSQAEVAEAGGIRHDTAQQPRVPRSLRVDLGALRLGYLRKDRFTLVLATLMTGLLALGLWVGWQQFHAKPGTQDQYPTNTQSIAARADNEDLLSLFDIPQADALMTVNKSNANPADGRLTGFTIPPIVEMLPQLLLPSKLHQPANTAGAVVPSNTTSISRTTSAPLLPTVPLPVPQLKAQGLMSQPTEHRQDPAPQPIKIVRPEYPKVAQLRHIEGGVLLELQVDSRGTVRKVRTITGNSLLREAAENAARQWQYPSYPEGQLSVPGVIRVRINFKLNPETTK